MKRYVPILAVSLIALGCTGSKDSAKPADPSKETAPSQSGSSEPAKSVPTLADLPAELKHDGYEYYGLGNEKPVDMEIKGGGKELTGSQTTKLTEIKDGKATFSVDRTGGLAGVGQNELTLEKDGIYIKSSTVMKVGAHDLEFPAKLTPGTSWPSNMEVEMEGQQMKLVSTNKVIGLKKITIPAGSYDAMLVESKGKGTINGKKITMESQSWHVKGIGAVKVSFKTTYADGKVDTNTMQMTK